MDVQIDEINTTLRMMDSNAMLSPQMMERIIQAVMARLKDEESRAKSLQEGRELRPSAASKPGERWKS